nr:PIG-L family deacetylase [uncultured Sulfurimonas sp.]
MTFSTLFLFLCIYLFIVYKRAQRYKYDTSKDYIYDLEKNLISTFKMDNYSVNLPDNYKEFDSLFLKIELDFNLISYFLKPYVQIQNTKHFFEYGSSGVRYLNISNIDDASIKLTLKNTTIKKDKISLYGYKNKIDLSKKILILAPHADDSEIAAFGLYKTAKNVTIVTTTIGEHGLCNYCDIYDNNKTKSSIKKAQLRTIDALATPLLGDVDIKNSLTLGYYGGSLKAMRDNKELEASSLVDGFLDMNLYRKVSHSDIKLKQNVKPMYNYFLDDIKDILTQINPDIIITPHPHIDSHQDHKQTTYTLIDAIKELDSNPKLLLYTNHLSLSETYPVGQLHSCIDLPPNKEEFYFDSLYSFSLDKELQIDKFFALESIHDLRDSLVFFSIKKAYKHLNKLIKRKLTGKDKSYYKRAIRANELFFVVESKNIDELTKI